MFVPFTQHPPEKRFVSLWEGVFFIAPRTLSAMVMAATEGGIPMSRYPVFRLAGSKGKFHRCLSH